MKRIKLTQKKYAIVDDEDYDDLMKHKWSYTEGCKKNGYAIRFDYIGGKDYAEKMVSMHRQILGLTDKKVTVQHVNRDGLDNRRKNLTICQSPRSGVKGVYWKNGKWTTVIRHKGNAMSAGVYKTVEQAKIAYDVACELIDRMPREQVRLAAYMAAGRPAALDVRSRIAVGDPHWMPDSRIF